MHNRSKRGKDLEEKLELVEFSKDSPVLVP